MCVGGLSTIIKLININISKELYIFLLIVGLKIDHELFPVPCKKL